MGNKVADYNTRYSEEGTNDENYTPVTLTVYLVNDDGDDARDELKLGTITINNKTYGETNKLFTLSNYSQSSTSNAFTNLITTALGITDIVGSEDAASDIAKSISSIVLSDTQLAYNRTSLNMSDEESYRSALNTYNSLTDGEQFDDYWEMVKAIYTNDKILKYYEYYQFKKCEFECTGVTYDSVSNRVSTITFEFTGNIE